MLSGEMIYVSMPRKNGFSSRGAHKVPIDVPPQSCTKNKIFKATRRGKKGNIYLDTILDL